MPALKHTIGCRIDGYESLDVTVDIGLTNDAIADGQARGEHIFVLDFPNWDERAEALGLGDKPALPLTSVDLVKQPNVLARYISGGYVITDAIEDYLETSRPNRSRR
jgi:hypothetical protein